MIDDIISAIDWVCALPCRVRIVAMPVYLILVLLVAIWAAGFLAKEGVRDFVRCR
jgi:hypothetical protein